MSIQDTTSNPPTPNKADVASAISKALVGQLGQTVFEMWFEAPDSITFDGRDVRILANSPFSLSRLQSKFSADVREAVHRIAGPQTQIDYLTREVPQTSNIPSATQETNSETPTDANVIEEQNLQSCFSFHTPSELTGPKQRQIRSNARYLSSFWFGDENRLAKASVEQVFDCPGQFSPLLMYGPTGCGKSHLLESVVNDCRRQLRLKRCVNVAAEQFTSEFIASLRGGSGLPMFRRRYRELDVLAIDGIQFFSKKRATLGEFLQTVDYLARAGKQVIVSSDRPLTELEDLGTDLAARLTGGLTCPLMYPGFDGRMWIIESICERRKFSLPVDVRELIAQHMTRDVRRVSGAINRLFAVSRSLNESITMPIAQEVLGDLLAFSSVSATLQGIEQAVCDFCGVKSNEIRSSSRRKRISTARMLAMYLARQHTGAAFSEIGEHFGNRRHSTAMAAEKKVVNWIESGESIALPNANYPADEVVRRIRSILRVG